MPKIATRVSQLTGEGALAVFTRAKELEKEGRSIIHLELGEPDFHPAAPVVDAVRAAVANGRDRYVSTRGIPPLREGIAEYLKRTRKLDIIPEQVLVAPGCKMALAVAMMALIEPGDEVLYPDPSFPIYPSFTRGLGGVAVPYALREKNEFQPDIAEIASKITPKTRMLIFNSPNNPTGTVFTDGVLNQIAELARKHDLWVLADEIYARILFTGEYKSIWSLPGMAERTVIIDGFSKSFAMTGWRLGYAVAQKNTSLMRWTWWCLTRLPAPRNLRRLPLWKRCRISPTLFRPWWRSTASAAICSWPSSIKFPAFAASHPMELFMPG